MRNRTQPDRSLTRNTGPGSPEEEQAPKWVPSNSSPFYITHEKSTNANPFYITHEKSTTEAPDCASWALNRWLIGGGESIPQLPHILDETTKAPPNEDPLWTEQEKGSKKEKMHPRMKVKEATPLWKSDSLKAKVKREGLPGAQPRPWVSVLVPLHVSLFKLLGFPHTMVDGFQEGFLPPRDDMFSRLHPFRAFTVALVPFTFQSVQSYLQRGSFETQPWGECGQWGLGPGQALSGHRQKRKEESSSHEVRKGPPDPDNRAQQAEPEQVYLAASSRHTGSPGSQLLPSPHRPHRPILEDKRANHTAGENRTQAPSPGPGLARTP
ncbi:hypothetical protein H8959_014902 [Pygathrix nigripes]